MSKTILKKQMLEPLLKLQMRSCMADAGDSAPYQKWAKRERCAPFPKTMAGVGHSKRIWKDAFRAAGAVQKNMFLKYVRRSGCWFPEKGCILEQQIFRLAQMILRDRGSTLYDQAVLFRGRRHTLDRWNGKMAGHIGTRPSALHSTFHFWRKSRKITSFLMLWISGCRSQLNGCMNVAMLCCHVRREMQVCDVVLRNAL